MKNNCAKASVFIWIGFVGAISFMEAWLKFRAPGVSLPIGLGIGRLVFFALNKVEWILLLITAVSLYPFVAINRKTRIALGISALILMLQTFWMLPVLDSRAELHITGVPVPDSNMHLYYVIAELTKMVGLFTLGVQLLRQKPCETKLK